MISFDLLVQAGDWGDRPDDEAIASLLAALEGETGLSGEHELSLVLSDDAHVRVLNRDWRDKDRPTNVLSFPAEDRDPDIAPALPMLGDVVLAEETVRREAREQDKGFRDHALHLIAHGVLHLLGHDHMDEAEAERMEDLEVKVLGRVGIGDPYT